MTPRHTVLDTALGPITLVADDDALTGYAGGLTRKRALLDLEEPALVRTGRLF